MAVIAGQGHDWPQSTILGHPSSDEVSPIFPDRPIRPLPKRKIRSRLSSDQAGAIPYPPALSSSSPLFGSPQSHNSHGGSQRNIEPLSQSRDGHDNHTCECGGDHGSDVDSEEDNSARTRSYGYESFENTNNKKKRKIPISTAGGIMPVEKLPSATEDRDLHSCGSPPSDAASLPATHASPISGSNNMRGRHAKSQVRNVPERRPLGPSINAVNTHSNGYLNKMKRDWNSASTHNEYESKAQKVDISATTPTAADYDSISSTSSGMENLSSTQRQQVPRHGKDFTFECKSTSSNRMGATQRSRAENALPPNLPLSENPQGFVTQGTQTSPRSNAQRVATPVKRADRAQALPPREGQRRSRRPDQEYAAAARQRQMQQDIANYHHPPRKEDIWICEFCEYEAIWGKPPIALVRQYEMKDRKERKAAEERRRLLEKAKAKGRKNKKSGKAIKATSNGTPTANQNPDSQYGIATPQEHDSQGEEFFDDDYDEDGGPSGQSLHYDDDIGYEDDPYLQSSSVNDVY